MDTAERVIVVGGGLVGSMAACFFAKRGVKVEVYELRQDPRLNALQRGRSINLALSVRGIAALESLGIMELVLPHMIPMRGRMIHHLDGKQKPIPYGVYGEAINSIDRKLLNEILLSHAEKLGVKVAFEHELLRADLEKGSVIFTDKQSNTTKSVEADLIVGADGAYSAVRRELMRRTRMDYSQEYIPHGYMELCIPASEHGEYKMKHNFLHIWPRKKFMMIALPNTDKSFTVTLFMPFEKFESIKSADELFQFFEENFPDSIPLIGKEELQTSFFKNPVGPLVTVKCAPYHYKDKCVIIGDAAHAMVPFYGQGMNCGFEDVLVLDQILSNPNAGKSIEERLNLYTETRHKDAVAICELALNNYIEMRSGVLTWAYYAKKITEEFLYRIIPKTVIPLYTMVSFTRIPYSQVIERNKQQSFWIKSVAGAGIGSILGFTLWKTAKIILKLKSI